MSHNFQAVCQQRHLGDLNSPPIRVYGGLLHTMWCLETTSGIYALKQLANTIDIKNPIVRHNYEQSEYIAHYFAQHGIPAIGALADDNNHYVTVIDNTAFLLYAWSNAQSISNVKVLPQHAFIIAKSLATMHSLALKLPAQENSSPDLLDLDNLMHSIDQAQKYHCSFATLLGEHTNFLYTIAKKYNAAIVKLNTDMIISHRDLDPKNVLWDGNNKPWIIDWESAGPINPTYDFITTAFYWSGIQHAFNQETFISMLEVYHNNGGRLATDKLESALYGTFSWLHWLLYNIQRAYTTQDLELKKMSGEQVIKTLATIRRLDSVIPDILERLHDTFK